MKKKLSGSQIKRLIIVLMILGLAIVTLILIGGPLVFWSLLTWLVNKMVLGSGMNVWLARGFMVPVAALLFYAIASMFSLKKKKRIIGAILLCTFLCLGSLAMYNFTKEQHFKVKNNEPVQWYSKTPDGYKLYPRSGYDPITGEKLQKVTPEVAKEIEILKTTKDKLIKPVQEEYRFFDFWGRPIRWYHKDAKDKIEIFGQPGSHPTYGEPLLPITKEVVGKYLKQIEREKVEKTIPQKSASLNRSRLYEQLPDELNFCGERLILDQVAKRRITDVLFLEAGNLSSRFILSIKNDLWFSYILVQLRNQALPLDLKYIPVAESGLNPHKLSAKNARGAWQLTPEIAEQFGLIVRVNEYDERCDFLRSTDVAISYLKELYERLHNWSNVIDEYGNIKGQDLLLRVIATKFIFENPEKYGFSREGWLSESTYTDWQVLEITLRVEKDHITIPEIVQEIKKRYPEWDGSQFEKNNPHILSDLSSGKYRVYLVKPSGTS